MPTGGAVSVAIGGSALVACVHDRVKREVTELAFDPTKTSVHLCTCCENVFLEPSDTEMFCRGCRGSFVHPLGGPLPAPKGRV
jgi:hypothetical protein